MKTLLVLLTKNSDGDYSEFLPLLESSDAVMIVVLIQEGVYLTKSPSSKTYVLEDDLISRNGQSPFPKITYQDLITMIFEVDAIISV